MKGKLNMWQMITDYITNEDNISYKAYGFRYGKHELHDYTSIKTEAECVLDLLNSMEVSPIHLHDIIEDHYAVV